MSEDEIIENLKDLLKHNYLEDVGYLREENDYVVYNNAIQGLLDLYNQEKEKNKELEEKLKIAKQLYNDSCICIATECVEKDKIRDMQRYREFELQQEYKDFENDVEWKTYNKILEEGNNE